MMYQYNQYMNKYNYSHGTTEIMRAVDAFFGWIIKGRSPRDAERMVRGSYGSLITDSALFYIKNNIKTV